MDNIRWGIVSTGNIAELFSQDMNFVRNGELAAVAARSLDSARAFAKKHHIAKAYEGYQAMFDDPDIDAVYIATPHTLHYENTVAALKAGKAVLCEKPITVSSEQCLKLTMLAKEQDVFLMEAIWTYFLPAIQKAKLWVDEGRIGSIKHIKADFGYPAPYDPNQRVYNAELAGGCLLDMGIYPLAIAAFFANQDFDKLNVLASLAPNGVEDDVLISATSGDIKLSLATSFQCRLRNSAYIIGDKGYIVIPDAFKAVECSLYQVDELIEHFKDERECLGYQFEAEHVGNMLQAGHKESNIVDHQRSWLLQTQMERIKQLF